MTDNLGISNDNLQGTEAGQLQGDASSQGAAEQVVTQEYITRAMFEEGLARIEQSIARVAQSQADKSVAGLRKQVERKLAEFSEFAKEAGMPQQYVDAEQQRIWREAIDEFRSQDNPAPVAQEDAVVEVNTWIMDIADELGVAPLYPKDAEFAQVNFKDPNPANFKAQYERAIRAKAARRYGAPAQAPQQDGAPPAPPAARVPMSGTGQPSGNPTLEQLTTQLQTLQRKASRTPADWAAMRDLEAKISAQLPRKK